MCVRHLPSSARVRAFLSAVVWALAGLASPSVSVAALPLSSAAPSQVTSSGSPVSVVRGVVHRVVRSVAHGS